MKSKLLQVISGDLMSKIMLLFVNLTLISIMSVDEYAKFALLQNAVALGYQLVCAAIERLYIADYDEFKLVLVPVIGLLILIVSTFFSIYIWNKVTILQFFISITGISVLSIYQLQRIKLQRLEFFWWFSFSEIVKNGIWALSVLALVITITPLSGLAVFASFIASTFVSIAFISKFKKTKIFEDRSIQIASAVKYMYANQSVFFYTLLAAAFPYFPILMAEAAYDQKMVATYGAALRYQGIFGIFAYALNTVLLPKLAKIEIGNNALLVTLKLYKKMPTFLGLASVAVLGIIWLMPYIDNGKYPNLPLCFMFMAGCSVASICSSPIITYFLATGKYKFILIPVIIGLFISIAGFYVFKGRFNGYEIGAACFAGYVSINISLLIISLKFATFSEECCK